MYNNIFDSHAHYDDERYDGEREQVIENLFDSGVCGIINIGCTLERSQKSVDFADKYENFYAAVGIHPEDVEDLPADYLDTLRKWTENEKVVAIGEIGLDYHYEGYNREKQIEVFKEQLELAKELDMPVIIHSRDATEDCMAILKEYKPKGVMHCFSGSAETAKEVLSLGMSISFTGVLTFKNARRALEALEVVPMDRLLLETDCPYMAPEPHRGERCDSSMIPFIAEKIAEIKGLDAQTVLNTCTENTKKLFNIK